METPIVLVLGSFEGLLTSSEVELMETEEAGLDEAPQTKASDFLGS